MHGWSKQYDHRGDTAPPSGYFHSLRVLPVSRTLHRALPERDEAMHAASYEFDGLLAMGRISFSTRFPSTAREECGTIGHKPRH